MTCQTLADFLPNMTQTWALYEIEIYGSLDVEVLHNKKLVITSWEEFRK